MTDKFQEKLESFSKFYNVEKFNDDTVCAIANIQQNKAMIKSYVSNSSIYDKHNNAIKMVHNVYKNADLNIVSWEITKIGILSPILIRRTIHVIMHVILFGVMFNYFLTSDISILAFSLTLALVAGAMQLVMTFLLMIINLYEIP